MSLGMSRNWHKLPVFPEERCKSCPGLLLGNEIPSGAPEIISTSIRAKKEKPDEPEFFPKARSRNHVLWCSQEAEKEKKQNGQRPTDLKIIAQLLHIYSDQAQSLAKLSIISERVQAGCPVPTCTADPALSRAKAALQDLSSLLCRGRKSLACLLQQEMFWNLNNAGDLRADSTDNEKKKELLLGNDCCFVTFP